MFENTPDLLQCDRFVRDKIQDTVGRYDIDGPVRQGNRFGFPLDNGDVVNSCLPDTLSGSFQHGVSKVDSEDLSVWAGLQGCDQNVGSCTRPDVANGITLPDDVCCERVPDTGK